MTSNQTNSKTSSGISVSPHRPISKRLHAGSPASYCLLFSFISFNESSLMVLVFRSILLSRDSVSQPVCFVTLSSYRFIMLHVCLFQFSLANFFLICCLISVLKQTAWLNTNIM